MTVAKIKHGEPSEGFGINNFFLLKIYEGFSFSHSRRMEKILTDNQSGKKYMLNPGPQDILDGIISYVPDHLWDYITVDNQEYPNNQSLVRLGSRG